MRDWVVVTGPGAIGGLLAAGLRDHGYAVALIARTPASTRRLYQKGLSITDLKGRTRRLRNWLKPSASPKFRQKCKAAFICVKAPDLAQALRSTKRFVSPETCVVSLLNGVTHVQALRKNFGDTRTVFGVCYIASLRRHPTSIHHMGGTQIDLAAFPKADMALRQAHLLLKKSGWTVKIVKSVERLLWTKIVLNSAVNPLGALVRKTNGELIRDPSLRDLLEKLTREATHVANACGHRPLYRDTVRRAIQGCLSAPDQINSMAQDMAAGRRTETDAILKPLVLAARKIKFPTLFDPLYRFVKKLERELSHER